MTYDPPLTQEELAALARAGHEPESEAGRLFVDAYRRTAAAAARYGLPPLEWTLAQKRRKA